MDNNISHKMKKINSILDIHLKTKAILIKRINELLNDLNNTTIKNEAHLHSVNKVRAKANEILAYLNR